MKQTMRTSRGTMGSAAAVAAILVLSGLVLPAPASSARNRGILGVDTANQGYLILYGSGGEDRARLSIDNNTDSGFLILRGPSDERTVYAGRSGGPADLGRLNLYSAGELRVELGADPYTDAGGLVLRDGSGAYTIILDGSTGDISKTGSNGFLTPHPEDPSKEIFYTSLEGPERGMYARGSATLENGEAVVKLPHHFSVLARVEGMGVQLTPNSADTFGLAVVRKTPGEIVVRELAGGHGNFSFDYLVFASRGDLPPLEVVRNRHVAKLQNTAEEGSDEDADHQLPESSAAPYDHEPIYEQGVK